MAGEKPFFIEGRITEVSKSASTAYVKVVNGNVYHLTPYTPGIDFDSLERGQIVRLEVTLLLTRVLSAEVLDQ